MRNPTPVTTNSMASESWSSENEYSTLKFPERNHVSGCGSTYGSDKEENWLAIHNDMKNAAPQKISAAAATPRRENRLPMTPLIAAPARGSSGMIQRCRLGVIV